VTHRVVAIDNIGALYTYTTRGDANKIDDPKPVPYYDVKAVVQYHIPLLGHALSFIRPPGLGFLIIVIPCLLIIVVELAKLAGYAKKSKARKP